MVLKIEFTLHAAEKLTERFVRDVKISPEVIEEVIKKPIFCQKQDNEKIKAIGTLTQEHVLVVIYKRAGKNVRIITFFPARKNRYER